MKTTEVLASTRIVYAAPNAARSKAARAGGQMPEPRSHLQLLHDVSLGVILEARR